MALIDDSQPPGSQKFPIDAVKRLETLLERIRESHDVRGVRDLAAEYRLVVREYYTMDVNDAEAKQRLMDLSSCLQQHPKAQEIYGNRTD
ncbi:hypothetical protein CMO83_05205 [Candidatus Woesearchaeota archaeon]|jgi:hypothetical protein|nr:hypothetical protein [Candidatus Woesearchaeota archaeon]|tara:strand:+ start:12146 stop:12415 length:270 start_codon:yes stop_codon:yes gene_type:complete